MFSRFAIGGALTFTKVLPDHPASAGWVLSYRLVLKSGAGVITFDAGADGDDHLVDVAAADQSAWVAGAYTWFSWVTRGAAVVNIDNGETVLLADPRAATGSLDMRSDAQIALDNVRATIRGKATADVLRYTIGGRSLERYSMTDLLALEQRLAADVANEKRAALMQAGKQDQRRLSVRLGRA